MSAAPPPVRLTPTIEIRETALTGARTWRSKTPLAVLARKRDHRGVVAIEGEAWHDDFAAVVRLTLTPDQAHELARQILAVADRARAEGRR